MRILGIVVFIAGVVLQPVGWMFTHWLTLVSGLAIVAGVVLIFSGRDEGGGGDGDPVKLTGREMPGDIHGYSGQMSGGRSTAWESGHADHGGGHGGAGD